MCKSLPALAVDCSLVFVILLIVTHDIVAIWICLVEVVVSSLLSTFLILTHDVVGIIHCLVFAFLVESELFLATGICLLRAHINYRLSELI